MACSYKVIVIGESGVGKTCLAYRYCKRKIPNPKPNPTTTVDFFRKTVNIDGEQLTLSIWDTAGLEKNHDCLITSHYRNLHAVVFVYDVTKLSSFERLPHWISKLEQNNDTPDVPRILVGNKCDCAEGLKAVATSTARQFASDHDMTFFETSALAEGTAAEVDAIFMFVARKIKERVPIEMSVCPEVQTRVIILKDDYTPSNDGCCSKISTFFRWVFGI